MKKLLSLFCLFFLLVACKDEYVAPNDTIDNAILGTWQVSYSQTIKGVRMRPDGKLEAVGESTDTITFLGKPHTPITSYMFGNQENRIDICEDNTIKIFLLNSRGGVTVTTDQVSYYVRQDTLFRRNATFDSAHKYKLQNDSLVIERIPGEETQWTYICSKYFRSTL